MADPSRSVGSRIVEVVIHSRISHAVALGKRKTSEAFASSSTSAPSTSSDEEEEDRSECEGEEEDDDDEAEEDEGEEEEKDAEEWVDRKSRPPGSETPTERRYRCTHDECTKSYTKPSRLAEHERSHTGERPYVCSTCTKSYLRESHLQAHTRSHLPASDRPFPCTEDTCSKRFWTAQHLNVHIASVHRGEKAFACAEEECEERFAKHNQLRRHIAEMHSPPGTKPYRCEAEGCTKSFATSQKLRSHSKLHYGNRYACIGANCTSNSTPGPSSAPPSPLYFPTWTALQAHIREHHPPTCPYPECSGRTFASHKGLKGHLKVHEEREIEDALEKAVGEVEDGDGDGKGRPRKRRRGGEVGRDWACEVEGCVKTFKSKKALTTHHNITHLGRRDHACSHPNCGQTFGYKHLLQRHSAKAHSTNGPFTSAAPTPAPEASTSTSTWNIDWITGTSYTSPSAHRNTRRALVPCHWPDRFDFEDVHEHEHEDEEETGEKATAGERCAYVFSRAYDLRRHLKAEHGFELGKDEVDGWVRGWRERHSEEN